jgi:hypothetical protein
MGQKPKFFYEDLLDGYGDKIIKNGKPIQTRNYLFTNNNGKPVVLQEHSQGHEKATPQHGAEAHFNVRPANRPSTGDLPGTHGHYNY